MGPKKSKQKYLDEEDEEETKVKNYDEEED